MLIIGGKELSYFTSLGFGRAIVSYKDYQTLRFKLAYEV
jgi:hypothetical protein